MIKDSLNKRLEEIDSDPQYAELDTTEKQYLAAEGIDIPTSLDNKIKKDVVAWGKELSTQQRDEVALKRRRQKSAKGRSEEQEKLETVPEGATVKEGDEQVPVKPLSQAEDEDDVTRYFRYKYENDPQYTKAFDALIGTQVGESVESFKRLMTETEGRIREADKKLKAGTISQEDFNKIKSQRDKLEKL